MIEKGRRQNSRENRPRFSEPGGEREGEELRFISHFAQRDKRKRAENNVDQ